MARSSASARALTDHDEIRQWAEERDAQPTCVKGTGGGDDIGMIRLDFPGYSGEGSLEPISWDEWLSKFDESNLALLVQDETANGEVSNFNKLVSRTTVQRASSSTGRRSGKKRQSGAKKTNRSGAVQRRRTAGASERRGSRKTAVRGKKKSASASRGRASKKSAVRSSSTKRTSSSAGGRRSNRKAA